MWTCGRVRDVDVSVSCRRGGTDMRTRGCVRAYEGMCTRIRRKAPPAPIDCRRRPHRLLSAPTPTPAQTDVSHTDSVRALIAAAVTFLSHRITGSLTHPVRLRPSAPLEVPIAVKSSPSLSPVASPTPHQSYATLRSSVSSAPCAHTNTPLPRRRRRTLRARCRIRRSSRAANGYKLIPVALMCVFGAEPTAGRLELTSQASYALALGPFLL
ncbi:hypothetical protein B0H10DRAFT_807957 [Mycena sp. CBHHK59/15]|nr:hypothetical protein B0H10DRAFT_807957 [Mycena sp. CBHHK59/15]